jgi:hypothetical protein
MKFTFIDPLGMMYTVHNYTVCMQGVSMIKTQQIEVRFFYSDRQRGHDDDYS